jgi:hypothetical protein
MTILVSERLTSCNDRNNPMLNVYAKHASILATLRLADSAFSAIGLAEIRRRAMQALKLQRECRSLWSRPESTSLGCATACSIEKNPASLLQWAHHPVEAKLLPMIQFDYPQQPRC